jgi:hypothetical protein
VCACVCVCVCMCVHVCACVCMCVHVCACVCMCVHVCACVCTCVHVCACVCMCVHVCASVSTHALTLRACVCIYGVHVCSCEACECSSVVRSYDFYAWPVTASFAGAGFLSLWCKTRLDHVPLALPIHHTGSGCGPCGPYLSALVHRACLEYA